MPLNLRNTKKSITFAPLLDQKPVNKQLERW